MDNIIKLYYRRRDNVIYEKLIEQLNNYPAKDYTIQQAEQLAKEVLKAGNYSNINGPIPIIKIANNFGFSCFKANDMPEDISGNIFVGETTKKFYNTDKVIVVGDKEVYEHQRFIIAHELAHYLIDYLGSPESKNNILFSRTYPKQNHNSDIEIRADRFAAELLMPAKLFLKQYLKAMEYSDYNKNYAVTYLSTFFKTKKSSIIRRIDEILSEK